MSRHEKALSRAIFVLKWKNYMPSVVVQHAKMYINMLEEAKREEEKPKKVEDSDILYRFVRVF